MESVEEEYNKTKIVPRKNPKLFLDNLNNQYEDEEYLQSKNTNKLINAESLEELLVDHKSLEELNNFDSHPRIKDSAQKRRNSLEIKKDIIFLKTTPRNREDLNSPIKKFIDKDKFSDKKKKHTSPRKDSHKQLNHSKTKKTRKFMFDAYHKNFSFKATSNKNIKSRMPKTAREIQNKRNSAILFKKKPVIDKNFKLKFKGNICKSFVNVFSTHKDTTRIKSERYFNSYNQNEFKKKEWVD